MFENFEINTGYIPGVVGKVTELHAKYYSTNWGFGHFFETKVATELSKFIRDYNNYKDRIWSLLLDGDIEGSIAIDGSSEVENIAHLRWFIVSDKLRGNGAGNYLMQRAVSFCQEAGYQKVYLWTFDGLQAARHLYEKFGFKLVKEYPGDQWGTTVSEQRFDLAL
jgi:N-acetylglutamate synthase-like GNAT family acetyltransferase